MIAGERQIRTGDVLYYIALGLYLLRTLMQSTFYAEYISDRTSNAFCMAAILLLVLHELLFEKYSASTWIWLAVSALFCLNALRVDHLPAACMFLLVFCGRNMSMDQMARFVLDLLAIFLVFIILSAELGLITNYVRLETTRNNREYLGFLYALYPGGYLFHIILLCFYLYRNKIPFSLLAALGVSALWIYRKTDSRMSFLLSLLLLALAFFLKLFPKIPEKLGKINIIHVLLYPAAAVFTIAVTVGYNLSVGWMARLNTVFAQRLVYQQTSFRRYGITWFGKEIRWVGNGLNASGVASPHNVLYVDNMYLQFLQKYGVLMACLVIICVVLAEWYFYKTRNYYLLMAFSVNALNGLINDSVMSLSYNIFWIAAAMAVFGSRRFRGEKRTSGEFRIEEKDLENLYDASQRRGERV